MEKRIRSPNYPALSLPDAIDKVAKLYGSLHTHAAPRDVVAKGMGYNSLNGASATAISALHKYGLLERTGDDIKVSERAHRILHFHSADERREAIREAAGEPQLFAELAERFPGRVPNEELLRNYLLRKSFAPSAVSQVVLAYRETLDFVAQEAGSGNPRGETPSEMPSMPEAHARPQDVTTALATGPLQEEERPIGRYDFEGGAYVRIVAGGDVETEAALDMVETLVKLKRSELAKRKPSVSDATRTPNAEDAKEGAHHDIFS